MALEMTAGDGLAGGVQPLDLSEPGPRGSQVGRVDSAGLVVMGKMAHFPPVRRDLDAGKGRIREPRDPGSRPLLRRGRGTCEQGEGHQQSCQPSHHRSPRHQHGQRGDDSQCPKIDTLHPSARLSRRVRPLTLPSPPMGERDEENPYSAAGSGSTRPELSSSSLGVPTGARTRRMRGMARGRRVKSTARSQKSSE